MCLHDNKESKIDLAFRELFCFIDEAVLPTEISPLRRERGKSFEIQNDDSYPISNQLISINYKAQTTLIKVKDEQADQFIKIQKLFRNINKTHPENKNKVLVHCAMGMSRSATVVIMFIMKLFQCKLDDAFEYVKTQRDATDPNDGFMD